MIYEETGKTATKKEKNIVNMETDYNEWVIISLVSKAFLQVMKTQTTCPYSILAFLAGLIEVGNVT